MAAHRPLLEGLAAGAGTAFTALLFGAMSLSFAVFALTLVVVAAAGLATRPFAPARLAGTVAGLVVALVLAGGAVYAYMVDTMT